MKHGITADEVALAFGPQEPVRISDSSIISLESSTLAAKAIASAALSAAMSAAAAAAAASNNASAGSESLPSALMPMVSPPPLITSAFDIRAGMGLVGFIDPAVGTTVGDLTGYGRVPALPASLPMSPAASTPALVPGSGSPSSNSLPLSSLVATLGTIASKEFVPPSPAVAASSIASADVVSNGQGIVGRGDQETVTDRATPVPAAAAVEAAAAALAAKEAGASAGLPLEPTISGELSPSSDVPSALSKLSAPPPPPAPSDSKVASINGLAEYAASATPALSPVAAPLSLCMTSGCVVPVSARGVRGLSLT